MKKRNYTQDTVRKLQGSVQIEHTLAKRGAAKLRELLANEPYVATLGAYSGQQAVQRPFEPLTFSSLFKKLPIISVSCHQPTSLFFWVL